MISSGTTLQRRVELYALEHSSSSEYQGHLERAVRYYSEWLNCTATISDLQDEPVSLWIASLEPTRSLRTVWGYRSNLLTIWRHTARAGLCDPPGNVRRVRKPQPRPIAWTQEELRRIIEACEAETRELPGGVTRGEYAQVLFSAAYDTGLRKGDLWRIDRGSIRDGQIYLAQHKTGCAHVCRIRPETERAVLAMPWEFPLRWPIAESPYYRMIKRIRTRAGVSGGGGLHRIRKTAASYVERDNPGAAQRFLGHLTPSMAKHYVDPSIAGSEPLLPPPLE